MAMNDDDENDDLKVSPSMSVGDFASSHPDFNNSPASQAPKQDMSLGDVRDMFKSAKDDLLASKTQGISQDDLDALHKHEAANMWTSLFMNFIGAAGGGVDASPYMKPLQTRLEQERQGLALKNQLANQQSQRAGQEQSFGMGQMKANQALSDQDRLNSPLTPVQKSLRDTMSQFTKAPAAEINTQRDFEQAFPQFVELGKLQNEQQMSKLRQAQMGKELTTIQNSDGSYGMGIIDKLNPSAPPVPIQGSVSPQLMGLEQRDTQNFAKQIKPETIAAHNSIQNYDHAFDNLNPQEAKTADELARRQLSDTVAKFDQGASKNIFSSANQAFATLDKIKTTKDFETPENPEIGKAAMQKYRSALDFATLAQFSGRPTNYQTNLNLGTSFGGTLAGTQVPQEKIDALRNILAQKTGGTLQTMLNSTKNKNAGLQTLKDTFGDATDDYLKSFHKVNSANKGSSSQGQGMDDAQSSQSLEDYLQKRGSQ